MAAHMQQEQPRVAVVTGDGRKSLLVVRWRLPQAAAAVSTADIASAAAAAAAVSAGAAAGCCYCCCVANFRD